MRLSAKRGKALLEEILELDANWYGLSFVSKPAPVIIAKGGELFRAAEASLREMKSMLKPAEKAEFSAIFYKLQGHYWTAQMSDGLARQVSLDYARLLSEYPADILQKACDEWLMDDQKKFFPKPGEIDKILRRLMHQRKFRITKLERLVKDAV